MSKNNKPDSAEPTTSKSSLSEQESDEKTARLQVGDKVNEPADKPQKAEAEQHGLAVHEQKLEQYEKTGLEAATALLAIKEGELFSQTHGTFDEYCQERWSIERAHANRLVNAAKVYISIKEYRDENDKAASVLPRSESQIRSIYRLKQDRWEAAWLKAVEVGGKKHPTASQVDQVVEKMLGANTTKAKTKVPFNEGIKEVKTRLEELQGMLEEIDAEEEFTVVQEILDMLATLTAPEKPKAAKKELPTKNTKNIKG